MQEIQDRRRSALYKYISQSKIMIADHAILPWLLLHWAQLHIFDPVGYDEHPVLLILPQ